MRTQIHPLFPTVNQASENSQTVYSDHAPMLYSLNVASQEIKIVALNTLGPSSAASGFHLGGNWETDEACKVRYEKIVSGLSNSVTKHGVEIIALQETHPDFIVPLLKSTLGEDWEIVATEVGLLTCYNNKRFKCENHKIDEPQRTHTFQFRDIKTNTVIFFHNVWTVFNPFPAQTENYYRSLLTGSEFSIVVGDTNSRIAPLEEEQQNIVTAVVPIGFNQLHGLDPDQQRGDFPDGGFVSDRNNKITQLKRQIIHYETAEIVTDERDLSKLEVGPYNMVLCLDDSYCKLPVINNQTLFQYQKWLSAQCKDSAIMVRMAANNLNQKAIGIRFSSRSEFIQALHSKLHNVKEIKFARIESDAECQQFPCIFIPMNKTESLHAVITKAIEKKVKNEINRIKKSWFNPFMRDGSEKIAALNLLLGSISKASADKYVDCIEQWKHEKSNGNDKDNAAILAEHRNRFFPKIRKELPTSSEKFLESIVQQAKAFYPNAT